MENQSSSSVPLSFILTHAWFRLGRADFKAGRGFCADYETVSARLQHMYEKGRQAQALVKVYGIKRLTATSYSALHKAGHVL